MSCSSLETQSRQVPQMRPPAPAVMWTLLTETCRSLFRTVFYPQILLKTLIYRGKAGVSPIVGSGRVAADSQMD